MKRYFVDERADCIAVRDRNNTDPDYPGLHADTAGVVFYRHGTLDTDRCPTCGSERHYGYLLHAECVAEAKRVCDELNAKDGAA